MARPKKKPEYDLAKIERELIEAVADAYFHPADGTEDDQGRMRLKELAKEFSMTPIKVRKLLVTAGVYDTPDCRRIQALYYSGMTIKEIQIETGLSAASISGYLPYRKTVYKLKERTVLAERLQRYRERKEVVQEIIDLMHNPDVAGLPDVVWKGIRLFEGYPFCTAEDERYNFTVSDDMIFFSSGGIIITRERVNETLGHIMKIREKDLRRENLEETAGKYLYPVFQRIGIMDRGKVRN